MALDLVGWNVVLDSDRADELSAFYEKLLGWTRFKGEEYTVLVNLEQTGTPTWLTIQQVDDYVPPVWPATLDKQQQMAHLDFSRSGCGRRGEICLVVRRKHIGAPI